MPRSRPTARTDVTVHFTRVEVTRIALDDGSNRQFDHSTMVAAARLLQPFGVRLTVVRRSDVPFAGADRTLTADRLREKLIPAIAALRVGVSNDPDALFGPVVTPEQSRAPVPGGTAKSVPTPTEKNSLGYDSICTQDPPCPLHEVDLETALTVETRYLVSLLTSQIAKNMIEVTKGGEAAVVYATTEPILMKLFNEFMAGDDI